MTNVPQTTQTQGETQTLAEKHASLSGYGPTSSVAQAQYRIDLVAKWPVRAGARVLELGCGQGDTTLALAEAVGENGRVDAVDPGPLDYGSPKTLGEAQATVSAGPLGARIEWVQAEPLAFLEANPEKQWDVAVLAHSLWYFASPALIRETLRALSTRARCVCLAEWSLEAAGAGTTHVLAVLAQGALEVRKPAGTSAANVRTVLAPVRIKALAAEAGLVLKEDSEALVAAGAGMFDGRWETGRALSAEFADEVEEWVKDEREKGVVYAMVDAVRASAGRVGGIKSVQSMEGWTACFGRKE